MANHGSKYKLWNAFAFRAPFPKAGALSLSKSLSLALTRGRKRTGRCEDAGPTQPCTQQALSPLLGHGASIPPELFPYILQFLPVAWGGPYYFRVDDLDNDALQPLKACSLVCVYWAKICRRRIFNSATLYICSYEDAEALRQIVTDRCPRFTPLTSLIKAIIVRQWYETPRSFLYILNYPPIRDKITTVSIEGPAPIKPLASRLDTPHWDLANVAVIPSIVTRTMHVNMGHVHFPCFMDVTKYLRHFRRASVFSLDCLTWDGTQHTLGILPPSPKRASGSMNSVSIAAKQCTHNLSICWKVAMASQDSPLHKLSAENHHRAMVVIQLLEDLSSTTQVMFRAREYPCDGSCVLDVTLSTTSPIHTSSHQQARIVIKFAAAANEHQEHKLQPVYVSTYFRLRADGSSPLPCIHAVQIAIREYGWTLQCVGLRSYNNQVLQRVLRRHPSLLNPIQDVPIYMFAISDARSTTSPAHEELLGSEKGWVAVHDSTTPNNSGPGSDAIFVYVNTLDGMPEEASVEIALIELNDMQ